MRPEFAKQTHAVTGCEMELHLTTEYLKQIGIPLVAYFPILLSLCEMMRYSPMEEGDVFRTCFSISVIKAIKKGLDV